MLVCLIFLSSTANSFAANSNDKKLITGPNGDSMTDVSMTLEEQEQILLEEPNLSEQQKNMIKEKFAFHKELVETIKSKEKSKKDSVSTLTTNNPSGTISVPYFKQETNYWCGPATTKQSIHFINASSSSQATIAQAIGTTTAGSDLLSQVNYLNKNQSRNAYMIVNSPSEALIKSIAEYAVRKPAPAIGRLKIAKGGNWAYSSAGHFLNVSGYSSYGSSIRVTDPYIGWITPSSTGSYFVTSAEFHTATKNHFANQISY